MKDLIIVDDSFTVRKVIELLLSPLGYNLTFAENANKALEIIKSGRFDAIILDYGLPDKDGAVFSSEIKKLYPDIPVLIMYNGKEYTADKILSQCKCEEVIEKPFDSQSFLTKIYSLKEKTIVVEKPIPSPEKMEDLFDLNIGEEFEVKEEKPTGPLEEKLETKDIGETIELEEVEELLDLEEIKEAEELDVEELRLGEEITTPKEEMISDTVTLEELLSEDIVVEEVIEEKDKIEIAETKKAEREETKFEEPSIDINEFFSDLNDILKEKDKTSAEKIFEEKKVKPMVEEVAKELREIESIVPSEKEELDIWDFEVPKEMPEEKTEKPAPLEGEKPGLISLERKELEKVIKEITYEVVEKIAWEVVPEIVDTIIKDKFGKK